MNKQPTYRQYRKWGHPPIRAWILSVPGPVWYGSAALIGVIVSFAFFGRY